MFYCTHFHILISKEYMVMEELTLGSEDTVHCINVVL